MTVPFDRTTLERLGADLVGRTLAIVERLLSAAADKGVLRVHEVVLVGGASRMPAIAQAIEERLGRRPSLVDPDHAVVRPCSFGILVEDGHDPSGTRQAVVHVVHRNVPLPATATIGFYTVVDSQDAVRVQVYEQAGALPSAEVADNRRVLHGDLTDRLPQAIAGGGQFLAEAFAARYRLRFGVVEPRSLGLRPGRHTPRRTDGQPRGGVVPRRNRPGAGARTGPSRPGSPPPGNRVLCVFGDGDVGDRERAIALARELCVQGVRIIVRGLGTAAAGALSALACPGQQDERQLIADEQSIRAGIASMAKGLTGAGPPERVADARRSHKGLDAPVDRGIEFRHPAVGSEVT
ncbi:hypothetical protein Amsp01_042810 [Amycolatopsis sp. NBRC 101858]|nr:hypothetical protein Amsp01_042810 [Amycolatopsis sp. NBRC 101858]